MDPSFFDEREIYKPQTVVSKTPGIFWILDKCHNPIPVDTAVEWAQFRENHKRVGLTQLADRWISTTFLGIDHGYTGNPPILFETMVFKGQYPETKGPIYEERYATWDEAVAGHDRAVECYK